MTKEYRCPADIPYPLHDSVVTEVDICGDDLHLVFADGFADTGTMCELIIHVVDFDFSDVHILSKWGRSGIFLGRKVYVQQ